MSFFIDSLGEDDRALLEDPALSLPLYGYVVGQEEEGESLYDPFEITDQLQATILDYASNPPRTETGHVRWLNLLGYRQGGKSTAGELVFYPPAAYRHGWKHTCIADTEKRANELHQRLQFCHKRWDERLRPPTITTRESRQISFEHGSTMTVLSAESDAAGVGLSFSSLHGSEMAYWKDAAYQMSLIVPASINRKNAAMLLECTPTPLSEPSALWWKDQYENSKKQAGRNLGAFFPFWDGKLCRRPWPKGASLDIEEQRLLDRYGAQGLTMENLAFRREMFEMDGEIRRNPDLFACYYPFDDVSCWMSAGKQLIPHRIVSKHTRLGGNTDLVDWPSAATYMEYRAPNPDAVYVIGVDPAGYAGRDHCAFSVLEVWADGEWEQVASFGGNVDPNEMSEKLIQVGLRYNKALIGVERNGVGNATIALLLQAGYPNIYYDRSRQPGIHKHNHEEFIAALNDALMDHLVLRDADLVSQMLSYQGDASVQRTVKAELLKPRHKGGRRDRHHWDKVSALMIAVLTAPSVSRRYRPKPQPENVIMHPGLGLTWAEVQAHITASRGAKKPARYARSRYRGR